MVDKYPTDSRQSKDLFFKLLFLTLVIRTRQNLCTVCHNYFYGHNNFYGHNQQNIDFKVQMIKSRVMKMVNLSCNSLIIPFNIHLCRNKGTGQNMIHFQAYWKFIWNVIAEKGKPSKSGQIRHVSSRRDCQLAY